MKVGFLKVLLGHMLNSEGWNIMPFGHSWQFLLNLFVFQNTYYKEPNVN
jgi:hypothetical protein